MNLKTKSTTKSRAEGTTSFSVAAFPLKQWVEWSTSCRKDFGDLRWIKMWNDHLRSKEYDFYTELVTRIQQLEVEIGILKNKGEPNKEVVKTMSKVF